MINNIVYAIVVLIILFSLYHFVKDMAIFFNKLWYMETPFTRVYAKFMRFQYDYL
jgi:hypothetical protein